ncbi:E3 ubiquitin-protein ligase NRDP1-like protein [Dinothrombium tinctorium]|uniref:E3 ubiquitin-protein ligase NRDP1-like protein n=1 Tax=Dinothrombium tinctorium TaxID=1965070 RepID=A0A443R3Z4_9ACAR|nr:E3 ubiquitin-protein ligase NRDP1-like protein [Dinothrombium tinctorium]
MGFKLGGINRDTYKDIICPICNDFLEQPVISVICNHIFCNDCIVNNFSNSFKCPIDSKELNSMSVSKVIPENVKSKLQQITVKCRNDECEEKLKLKDIRRHEQYDCWYTKIDCKKGCGKSISVIDEKIHLIVCGMIALRDDQKCLPSPTPTPSSSPKTSPVVGKKSPSSNVPHWNLATNTSKKKKHKKKSNCYIQ